MIRRTTLLSALAVSLLLGACDSTDNAAFTDAQTADIPAPSPRVDYWPVLGPLVAGDYDGECMRVPHATMDGVTIGAGGVAAGGGLEVDFRETETTSLKRTREQDGRHATTMWLTNKPATAGMLTLQSGVGDKGVLQLSREDVSLMCKDIAGADRMNARPLSQALASLFDVKRQTLSCNDSSNVMEQFDLDVAVGGGMVKTGDAYVDIAAMTSESVHFDNMLDGMALILEQPDQRIHLIYHGAGKLASLRVNGRENTLTCEMKD